MLPDLYWVRDDVLAGKEYEHANDLAMLKQQANFGANSSTPLMARLGSECKALFEKRGDWL